MDLSSSLQSSINHWNWILNYPRKLKGIKGIEPNLCLFSFHFEDVVFCLAACVILHLDSI